MSIEIRGITKKFKDFVALNEINLDVRSGELIALLGPSGSGKTTLLRIIAGLEAPDSGLILLHGEESHLKHISERRVGFVFQHYALFKHMTVFNNVAFGLHVRNRRDRPTRQQIKKRVMELLQLLHLDQFRDRYPGQLSGGQRQRVALARALAVDPVVLLLDEPFGALDAKVRKELRRWLRRLHDTLAVTTIFVTHDQEEALEVADRVVVMSEGKIEQVGSPEEVYSCPANSFVYDFLGNYNEFEGWRDNSGLVHLVDYLPIVPEAISPISKPVEEGFFKRLFNRVLGKVPLPLQKPVERFQTVRGEGSMIKLFARPHEMLIAKTRGNEGQYLAAKVVHINPAGPLVKVELERMNGSLLQIDTAKEIVDELNLRKGEEVFVKPRVIQVFE